MKNKKISPERANFFIKQADAILEERLSELTIVLNKCFLRSQGIFAEEGPALISKGAADILKKDSSYVRIFISSGDYEEDKIEKMMANNTELFSLIISNIESFPEKEK